MPKFRSSAATRPVAFSSGWRMKRASDGDSPGVRSIPIVKPKSSAVSRLRMADASTLRPRPPASTPRSMGKVAVLSPWKLKLKSSSRSVNDDPIDWKVRCSTWSSSFTVGVVSVAK